MCSTDLDASDVWNLHIVVARKRHKCSECSLPIPVGCRHLRIGSLFEGSWETIREHVECDAVAEFVRKKICEARGERGFIPVGGLDEEIRNLDYYSAPELTVDDIAACEALGIEVDWSDESDPTVGYEEVASWVWDLATAPYQEAAA